MKIKVIEYIGRIQDGGAETLVKDYALLLDKEKFDVYVVCRDVVKSSHVYKVLIENNVKLISMYRGFDIPERIFARLLGPRYVANKLRKIINEIKPDVIHAHLECLETLYYVKDLLYGVKLLFTCHNLPKMCIGKDRPKEAKACKYLIEHNDMQVIALHEDMAKEINKMFGINDTAVIRNGVDFNKFRNVSDTKEEIRQELGIPIDGYVIGQVGRFAYQKNPEFTVNIFNELLKTNPNSYLLLIGRGKQEESLKKQVNDLGIDKNVCILTNRDDIARLLKAMDVFIFPSRFEGLGIVLIEAQVAGLPCVTSDNIPREAYQSRKITRLSLDAPKNDWVQALLNPLGNIGKYGDINNYDMSKEIKRLEDLYIK